MNVDNKKVLWVKGMAGWTLLSSDNYFSVKDEDGNCYNIVNFYKEQLDEVVKKGVKWPIKILVLDGNLAVIHDERIADDYYRKKICEVCCSRELLPYTQRLVQLRGIARGERRENGDGVCINLVSRSDRILNDEF